MHPAMMIAIGVLALALAWYFAGKILQPARERRETHEATRQLEPESDDIWKGFEEARNKYPVVVFED